jgi:hypothetical protein
MSKIIQWQSKKSGLSSNKLQTANKQKGPTAMANPNGARA